MNDRIDVSQLSVYGAAGFVMDLALRRLLTEKGIITEDEYRDKLEATVKGLIEDAPNESDRRFWSLIEQSLSEMNDDESGFQSE